MSYGSVTAKAAWGVRGGKSGRAVRSWVEDTPAAADRRDIPSVTGQRCVLIQPFYMHADILINYANAHSLHTDACCYCRTYYIIFPWQPDTRAQWHSYTSDKIHRIQVVLAIGICNHCSDHHSNVSLMQGPPAEVFHLFWSHPLPKIGWHDVALCDRSAGLIL